MSISPGDTLTIAAHEVMATLSQHVLVDGYDLVLDIRKSSGSWLVDARDGRRYLDMFSFFASLPLGMNHPGLVEDRAFLDDLATAALHKVSNPDVYTVEYARFVATFHRVLGDPELPHLFFIDGGALAVENALKIAFDWKAKRDGLPGHRDYQVLHLASAFHGRSGYTLSVTNTDPAKTALFPRWSWPRVPVPAVRFPLARDRAERAEADSLAHARAALDAADGTIACFLLEPIQGEGGDNHLRVEFLQQIERLCHEHDILLVLDEVQTGCGLTGTAWAYQQLGIRPDLVAFGKKTQVCGVMGGRRVDLVPDNAFRVSSRISSTWGGNLADMVRATRILEIIEESALIARAASTGKHLTAGLSALATTFPNLVTNVRGRGLMCAFDLPDPSLRDEVVTRMRVDDGVLILPSGTCSVRFRPALTVSPSELDLALGALHRALAPHSRGEQ
ncbi:L-lysine 6-transaminase [Frankia sp. CiP3]|uniref:L-lysine 6-transaminase n=1 Tax=Frankia sp. CiP3 TaxID=2880971 RepID=UPI001EF6A921|nr:L-lysine 6-transaminase [Frankia sp. CiP3]